MGRDEAARDVKAFGGNFSFFEKTKFLSKSRRISSSQCYKTFPMMEFEPITSGVGSYRFAN